MAGLYNLIYSTFYQAKVDLIGRKHLHSLRSATQAIKAIGNKLLILAS